MRIDRNLTIALASSIWSTAVGLAVIPLYVKYLGVEGYGLIGFLATAQAFIQILDLGLTTTVNREVARAVVSGDLTKARALLHTSATIYWAMAAVISVAAFVLAPVAAASWLGASQLGSETVTGAVALAGLVIACRWPGQLYQGALMGAQRFLISSLLNAALVTVASGGALILLMFVAPSIEVFLAWQAFVSLGFVLAARLSSWRVLGRQCVRFEPQHFKHLWRFSASVMIITAMGIALSQFDKIILSKTLSLAEYGQYMLAFAVAGVLYVLSSPLFNVMYPRFSALVHAGDTDRLSVAYHLSTRLMATILFPWAVLIAVFSEELIQTWTGNPLLAQSAAAVLPMLAVGAALHGVMHIPYALQLAYSKTRLILTINAVLLAAALPLTAVLAFNFGAVGGALAWLALHVLYLALGSWLTHRTLLKGHGIRWILHDVGIPLAISLVMGLLARDIALAFDASAPVRLGCAAIWMLATSALIVAMSPALRDAGRQRLRHWTHSSHPRTTE